jgi:glutamyl-tRNA synthetase
MGYLPEGLINYLVRLGWSHGDQEFFTVSELIEKFTLENVGSSSGMFDPEKLRAINGEHIKAARTEDLARELIPRIRARGYSVEEGKKLERIVGCFKERARTLEEMVEQAEFFYREKIDYDEKAATKFLTGNALAPLERIIENIRAMETLDHERLEIMFRNTAEQLGVKLVNVAQPVRVALTGRTASPGLFEIMDILGKEQVLKRLSRAIVSIREGRHGDTRR